GGRDLARPDRQTHCKLASADIDGGSALGGDRRVELQVAHESLSKVGSTGLPADRKRSKSGPARRPWTVIFRQRDPIWTRAARHRARDGGRRGGTRVARPPGAAAARSPRS